MSTSRHEDERLSVERERVCACTYVPMYYVHVCTRTQRVHARTLSTFVRTPLQAPLSLLFRWNFFENVETTLSPRQYISLSLSTLFWLDLR